MWKYYFSKHDQRYSKSNNKKDNSITCFDDLIHAVDKSISCESRKKMEEYALQHKEMNLLELYKHFNFPVPKTEEEKSDPKFEINILYKFDSKGQKVPR